MLRNTSQSMWIHTSPSFHCSPVNNIRCGPTQYPDQSGEGYFSPDMARGVEGGPPSNGPPMPDCGKKCNQCECTPLQTSHVRKHVKADQIVQHSSQLPEMQPMQCECTDKPSEKAHESSPQAHQGNTPLYRAYNALFAVAKTT